MKHLILGLFVSSLLTACASQGTLSTKDIAKADARIQRISNIR